MPINKLKMVIKLILKEKKMPKKTIKTKNNQVAAVVMKNQDRNN